MNNHDTAQDPSFASCVAVGFVGGLVFWSLLSGAAPLLSLLP